MAETTIDTELAEEFSGSYTSESEAPRVGRGSSLTAPGQALGRRKEAVARVRLIPGSGEWKINGRTLDDYFPNKLHQQLVRSPFALLDLEGRFDVVARINGGGVSGQAGALRLGIARALNDIDRDSNRPALKKAGFLTRDARAVERKKAGLKKGDVVVEVDGHRIEADEELNGTVRSMAPNTKATFKVQRGSEVKEIQVTLGDSDSK